LCGDYFRGIDSNPTARGLGMRISQQGCPILMQGHGKVVK